MPVLEHDVHESVVQKDGAVYGCWNRESFAGSYPFTGMLHDGGRIIPISIGVPHRMSNECRFDMSLSDPKCTGCKHRGSGENYDQMIRGMGK